MHPVLSPTTLLNIANEYGTPLYVYDAKCIEHQYKLLAHTFRRNDTRITVFPRSLSLLRAFSNLILSF